MSDLAVMEHFRTLEQRMMDHVRRLLDDSRLRIDTLSGRRVVQSLEKEVEVADQSLELKRLMSQLNCADRTIESAMPVQPSLRVILKRRKWFVFTQPTGQLEVHCLSPVQALLSGQPPAALTGSEVQKWLTSHNATRARVPLTLVLMCPSGFTREAHDLAERRADRTLILVEPNAAGGWNVVGPSETKSLVDLFDPESVEQKQSRLTELIARRQAELLSGGLAGDKLAAATGLPIGFVESFLKNYAAQSGDLLSRRLEGRVVLFSTSAAPPPRQGVAMPLLQRIRAIFSGQGEEEKKIAFLSERRAMLAQQRERSVEQMDQLEKRETELRRSFSDSPAESARRRIASQLLQTRKELARRQQLLSVTAQQEEIIAAHLHNLQLVRQGRKAALPAGDQLAADAQMAEETLADLQALSEMGSQNLTVHEGGLSQEEQELYEQLQEQERDQSAVAPEHAPTAINALRVDAPRIDVPPAAGPAASPAPDTKRAADESAL